MKFGQSAWNPIRRLALTGGVISSRMASKTTLNWTSYFRSSTASFRASSSLETTNPRSRTKARMMAILTRMARSLLRTEESIATPCSVNAKGRYRRPPQDLEVTICDLKIYAAMASFELVANCDRVPPQLEVANCDLKFAQRIWRQALPAFRLHRARRGHALQRPAFPACRRGEHRHHAHLRPAPAADGLQRPPC